MKGLNALSASLLLAVLPAGSVQLQGDSQGSQSQTQQASEAPKSEQLPIDSIKKTVLFFHTEFLQNSQPKSWDGTGFFILESDSRLKGRGVVWLVTNKHMIRSPIGPYFNGVGIRANTKAPTPSGNQFAEDILPVMDVAGNLYWCIDPEDETVDLALNAALP